MKSNKQRRKEIKLKRIEQAKKIAQAREYSDLQDKLSMLGSVKADPDELVHNNTYGALPEYYFDKHFVCIDCGSQEVWTAKQQKWWYEIAKGNINTTAVRCRPCRKIKREKKAASNRINNK